MASLSALGVEGTSSDRVGVSGAPSSYALRAPPSVAQASDRGASPPAVAHASAFPEVATFSADRLELDPSLSRLELRGHVAIAVDRYRLRGERLTLRRTSGGVSVSGSGRLALCPCEHPPVTFGFATATIAAPGDLRLTWPTLYAFGVPILWLPYLWLRSPDHVGLLPLTVAWRGPDGLLLGSGVHLPLAEAALDLTVAGYVRGGVDASARWTSARTSTEVRWDYLQGSALTLDLRGAEPVGKSGGVAFDVDALRGRRALTGPALLETVSQREDRARAVVGWAGDGAVVGMALFADSPRGAAVTSGVVAGPGVHAGYGTALGDAGTADVQVGARTLGGAGVAMTLLTESGELHADTHAGAVAFSTEARARARETIDPYESGHAVTAGGGAEASIPLVKRFGAASVWQHWLTPFVGATGGCADTREPSVLDALATDGAFFSGYGGLRTSLGRIDADRGAATASVRVGYLAEGGVTPNPVVAWATTARSRVVTLGGEGVSLVRGPESGVVLLSALVGSETSWFLEGRVAGGYGEAPADARFFLEGWNAPSRRFMSPEAGWSVGGRLGIPWTRWLTTKADADYDVQNHELLGVRGAVGYRHPCGCLAVTVWGGHRIGRRGVDSWIAVDLTP